jgi:microsomal dipeptidase-like Zn-dependent dipeptidase
MLEARGFKDQEIGMIVGGNFLRVMRAVLPAD